MTQPIFTMALISHKFFQKKFYVLVKPVWKNHVVFSSEKYVHLGIVKYLRIYHQPKPIVAFNYDFQTPTLECSLFIHILKKKLGHEWFSEIFIYLKSQTQLASKNQMCSPNFGFF